MTRESRWFFGLAALLFCSLAIGPVAQAGPRVLCQGPRCGEIAGRLVKALQQERADIGLASISVRRDRPNWVVIIKLYQPGSSTPGLVQVLSAVRGQVSSGALQSLAKKAAGGAPTSRASKSQPSIENEAAPARASQAQRRGADHLSPKLEAAAKPRVPSKEGLLVASQGEPAQAERAATTTSAGVDQVLGFEVSTERAPRRTAGPSRRLGSVRAAPAAGARRRLPRAEAGRVFRLEVGAGFGSRAFSLETGASGVDYDSGLHAQINGAAELYLLRLITDSAISGLGLRVSFATSAGLQSNLDSVDGSSVATAVQSLWAGLSYAVPPFASRWAPRLEARLGAAQNWFAVDQNPTVSDLSLTSLAMGGGLRLPLASYLIPGLAAEYRAVVSARSAMFDPYQVSAGGLQGVLLEGTVRGAVGKGFGYRLYLGLEWLWGTFPHAFSGAGLSVADRTFSGGALLTYEL